MGRIQLLDDTLANQIAAGEVVERPASAAKELLENAVDAGATRITCEIAGGGVDLLRVVDDGHGMGAEDAALALARHATSKIRAAADLHHIHTLGFRGEALPSIASVSRLSLRTREPDALGAVLIEVEGGVQQPAREVGGPPGTEVRIADLFFNVPARRKFLRQANTESNHVLEVVQRLALCYPDVAFRFIRDGRTTLDVPRDQGLHARTRAIFGERATEGLQPVRYDLGNGFSVDGLIGPPAGARSTPRHYHTFINGRYVRDRVVMAAVQSAYGHRLERGRHPFVVLRLAVPPETVDVNVHPAKTEVRFVDSRVIHRLIAQGLDGTLRGEPWSAPAAAPAGGKRYTLTSPGEGGAPAGEAAAAGSSDAGAGPAAPSSDRAGLDAHRQRIFDAMERLGARRRGLGRPATPPPGVHDRVPVAAEPPASRPNAGPPPGGRREGAPDAGRPAPEVTRFQLNPPAARPAPREEAAPITGLAHARALGDLALERLVFTGLIGPKWAAFRAVDGVLLVDVFAARTRLAYARLFDGAPGRPLAPPVPIELPPLDARRLPEVEGALLRFGLEIAHLGRDSFAVARLPAGLPPDAAAATVAAVLAAPAAPAHLCLAIAEGVARHAGAPTPAEAAGWPAALADLRHTPPKPVPWAVALPDAELLRRRTADVLK